MTKWNPDHYQLGKIQVWDFIVDQDLNFLEGNVVKYICRAGNKSEESRFDDLLKAQAYIHKLIQTEIHASTRSDGPSPELQDNHGSTMCVEGCQCPCHAEETDL